MDNAQLAQFAHCILKDFVTGGDALDEWLLRCSHGGTFAEDVRKLHYYYSGDLWLSSTLEQSTFSCCATAVHYQEWQCATFTATAL